MLTHAPTSASVRRAPLARRPVPSLPAAMAEDRAKGACACGGGCPRCAGAVQPKLLVGDVDDPAEREADVIADAVMRDPGEREDDEIGKDKPVVRRVAAGGGGPRGGGMAIGPGAAAGIEGATRGGEPLPEGVRAAMEPRFGADFSDVRIHRGTEAAASAASIGARAYTLGRDVVFGAGQYDPAGADGRRLLAHELVHVVQQATGPTVIRRDLATPPPAVAPAAQPDLTPAQIREAIRFNSGFYDAANTRLIQSIMGGTVTGRWTEDDIIAIASTQEEYGLKKDGKVGPDTFDFITNEQTLEGLGTDTPNCLTAFRVIPFPVQGATTAGPGGTTRIVGHHRVEARFSGRCDCSEFQYRQFIAGVATATRGGTIQDLSGFFSHIPGGSLPVAMTEDGNTTCPSQNYGHREQPGQPADTVRCGEDHYFDAGGTENQASGCLYRAQDHPQITVNGLATGDTVDLLVQFRGEIRRNGTVISTRTWTTIDNSLVTP